MRYAFTPAILVLAIGLVACDGGGSGNNITIKGSTASLATSSSMIDPSVFPAVSGIDPDVVKIQVYKIALSTSEDCSNPTTVVDNGDTPVERDFVQSAEIGSGSLANGTYNCVIIEMSDQVTFSPATSGGVCTADEEFTMDVCRSHGEHEDAPISELIDGTEVTCTAGDNRIAIYISTLSTTLPREPEDEGEDEGSPYIAPTADSTADGFKLEAALVVDGAMTMEFVADFSGRVAEENHDGEDTCGMESPNWGFQKI